MEFVTMACVLVAMAIEGRPVNRPCVPMIVLDTVSVQTFDAPVTLRGKASTAPFRDAIPGVMHTATVTTANAFATKGGAMPLSQAVPT